MVVTFVVGVVGFEENELNIMLTNTQFKLTSVFLFHKYAGKLNFFEIGSSLLINFLNKVFD